MSFTRQSVAVFAAGALFGFGVATVPGVFAEGPVEEGHHVYWEGARLFAQVMERVKEDYVDPVSDEQLMRAAVRGMVSSLDPYSAFLEADEYEEVRDSSAGAYTGVGIEVAIENGIARVVAPIDDSPAAHAGILSGDEIEAIDDIPVETDSLDLVINRMRGKPGSKVKLTMRRKGRPDPIQFLLERANVEVHSVKQELLEPGYGYIRISQFSETTAHDLTHAITQIKSRSPGGIKGLVLDLRNNPGGVLEAAVGVSDAFLDEGVIVTANGRSPEARFELNASKGDLIDGAPLTILVDGGSASSSEIVAGALRDHHRATLIGQKTYGKGLVQTVMPLADGRALKLTTSRYYTPSGESINSRGIIPDIVVDDQHLRDFVPGPMTSALAHRDYEVGLALDALKRTSIRQSSLR